MRQLTLKNHELKSFDKDQIDNVKQLAFKQALGFINQWNRGETAFTFNTSGSTGQPKTIKLERWKMELSARRTIEALSLSENQTALLCMSSHFIGGAMMLVRALMAGMNLIIVPPMRQPLEYVTQTFDFTAMVPMQLNELLEKGSKEQLQLLSSSQHILLGGASVPNELLDQIMSLPTTYWSTYGMTETVSHIALRQLNGVSKTKYFEVLDDIKIKSGSEGQLCIRDSITNDQWLKTNDVVNITGPKRFEWMGRLDNVINTGGVKVLAEKVEMGISEVVREVLPGCRYFVAGTPDDTFGSAVTLFVEYRQLLLEINILEKLKLQSPLSKYEFPKKLILLASFPETASGKIDKQSILKSHS